MRVERNGCPWLGALVVAAALTSSSVAHADVPDATWGALRDRDVILETQGGKLIGGKLIDVQPTSVALLLSSGDSLMIDRSGVRSARAARGDESLPSYTHVPLPVFPMQEPPRILRWNEGEVIPPGYRKGTEIRTDLVIGGSVTFGVAWLPTALAGILAGPWAAIPVVGPFLLRPVEGKFTDDFTFFLALDGVQQAVGLALVITGFAMPRTVLLRSDVKAAKTWWVPVPTSFGKGSIGLGIVGTM